MILRSVGVSVKKNTVYRNTFVLKHGALHINKAGITASQRVSDEAKEDCLWNHGVDKRHAVTRKRPKSFCQKCKWQVTVKHICTLRMWLQNQIQCHSAKSAGGRLQLNRHEADECGLIRNGNQMSVVV